MAKIGKPTKLPDFALDMTRGAKSPHEKAYAALLAASDKATVDNPIGYILRIQTADNYARYLVVQAKPLLLSHIDYMDGYYAPDAHIRGLRLADVRQAIEWDKIMGALR